MKKIKTFVVFLLFAHILLCAYDVWPVSKSVSVSPNILELQLTLGGRAIDIILDGDWVKLNNTVNQMQQTVNALVEQNRNLQDKTFKSFLNKFWILFFSISQLFKALSLIISIIIAPIFAKLLIFYYAPRFAKNTTNVFDSGNLEKSGAIEVVNGNKKNISVNLAAGESMLVKSDRIHGYSEKSDIKKDKALLFNSNNPIISLLSGLAEMDRYKNKSSEPVEFAIKPLNGYEYFAELYLKNCRGAFVAPKSIIGISPNLKLKAKWCVKKFLYTGRLRYYFISGSGRILLSANGGITSLQETDGYRITEKSNILLADLSITTKAIRTDICYNFVMENAELFDISVSGNSVVLIRNNSEEKSFGQKVMSTDSFLNVVGHFLGF